MAVCTSAVSATPRRASVHCSGLRSAAGYIRSQVTRQLKLRHAPDLTFLFDPSLEIADRVATLLKEAQSRNE